MASTTTNYGFDVPTSSDLVKNGATQIALLGQDLDTFLFRPFTRNGVLNSAMNIWQRGTSVAVAASSKTYTADRWWGARGGSVAGSTVSRQVTGDTTNLPFIQYCARVQRDSGNTSTQFISFTQDFETVNSIPYSGRTVTLSFYARAGANYSSASSALPVSVVTGTGTDQSLSSGYTGQATAFSGTATLTTTWQRFTFTGSIAATATQIGLQPYYVPVGTAGANDYFEITGVMLEVGNQASPFASATGTIQGELSACQRYLPKLTVTSDTFGMVSSTTQSYYSFKLPVTARVAPTSTTVSALSDFKVFNASLANGTPTSINFNAGGTDYVSLGVNTTAGSPTLVTGQCALLTLNNAGGYILFNGCEL